MTQQNDPCVHCGGTGAVDDGELTHYEGTNIPYENGPIKCMKDCPACGGRVASLSALPAGEPVAWEWDTPVSNGTWRGNLGYIPPAEPFGYKRLRPLYATPQPAIPQGVSDEDLIERWNALCERRPLMSWADKIRALLSPTPEQAAPDAGGKEGQQ